MTETGEELQDVEGIQIHTGYSKKSNVVGACCVVVNGPQLAHAVKDQIIKP